MKAERKIRENFNEPGMPTAIFVRRKKLFRAVIAEIKRLNAGLALANKKIRYAEIHMTLEEWDQIEPTPM